MHIAFFCQYYPPETNAPASRTHEHARQWVASGHQVTVLCALPNHPDGVIPVGYRGRWLIHETIDGVNVLRTWLYATPNKDKLLRSFSFISFMVSSFCTGMTKLKKPDIIIGTSPQLLCAFAAYLVAAIQRVPFVLEIRDLWPQQIVDLGVIKSPLIIRPLVAIEMLLYRRAHTIIVVAGAMREKLISRGVPAEKIKVIPNGVDPDFFRPTPKAQHIRKQAGWENRFVALYIGTLGLSQGLDTLLETATLLEKDHPEVLIVLAGSGAERVRLQEKKAALGLGNVEFLPAQPKDRMPTLYCAADCCLVPLKDRDVFRHTIPSKMFEIMSCARPIILGVSGQAQTILERANAGIAIPPENPQALADTILHLKNNPELAQVYGQQGRDYVSVWYNRALNAKEYLEILGQTLA